MKRVRLLFVIISLFFVVNANAASQWSGFKQITSIETTRTGEFVLYFDSLVNSVCTSAGNGKALYIGQNENGVTSDGAKAMLATALMAMSLGLKVEVFYDDSTSYCWGGLLYASK